MKSTKWRKWTFLNSFFFFRQYLPLSWLERITRWQLFNSRTTRHIDCHKNGRYAADILWESDLLWLTLCNIIFLFTSFVHYTKEIIKQLLLLSNSISNLVSGPDEKGIFRVYCACQSKTRFHLMSRGTQYISLERSRFCFMILKTSHILRKLHPIFLRWAPFCLNSGEERNINRVIRAWNGLFCFRALIKVLCEQTRKLTYDFLDYV